MESVLHVLPGPSAFASTCTFQSAVQGPRPHILRGSFTTLQTSHTPSLLLQCLPCAVRAPPGKRDRWQPRKATADIDVPSPLNERDRVARKKAPGIASAGGAVLSGSGSASDNAVASADPQPAPVTGGAGASAGRGASATGRGASPAGRAPSAAPPASPRASKASPGPLASSRTAGSGRDAQKRSKSSTVIDYMLAVKDMLKADGGPPRWFCPTNGTPPEGEVVPKLFFVPGIEGIGLGLGPQMDSLSRLFATQCLHLPTADRTSFQGIVEVVELALQEAALEAPGRALYLLGESFGACVALVVAARNPTLPIQLVLVNAATAFEKSELQPILPLLRLMPEEVYKTTPYLFSFIMGDPIRMALRGAEPGLSPPEQAGFLWQTLPAMLPTLPVLAEILPKQTLLWKLDLLKEGSAAANAALASVKAPTLVLASGKDRMIPSATEGTRLAKGIPGARLRRFPDSGHTLLLEEGMDLAATIKGAGFYLRQGRDDDPITGFVPPSPEECGRIRNGPLRTIERLCSPVFFSTSGSGAVVQGLGQLPVDGPLLFVGNHQLIGPDLGIIISQILEERGLLVRGLAHPVAMAIWEGTEAGTQALDDDRGESASAMSDFFRTFGAVTVTPKNLYKILETGGAALLFPGGVREALKRKGEEYKLFWPRRAEFVRMAVRHGATIVPFGAVGVDDGLQIVLDSNEIQQLPFGIGADMEKQARKMPLARSDASDSDDTDELFLAPYLLPRLPPSRMYFKFQKPISTKGFLEDGYLRDKDKTARLYGEVKGEVEAALAYILDKREEDPYKEFGSRALYEASWNWERQAPTFRP